MTPLARGRIRRGVALMEEHRRRCVMWTITLPGDALDALAEMDTWWRFQDAIRHGLRRLLARAGLPDWAAAVVELQPKRTRAEGRPCPHLHVVYVGKRPGRKVWPIHTSALDALIERALCAAGVGGIDVSAAGEVRAIRKSVGGYLASYMTKGGDLEPVCGRQLELIPRQWWFMTAGLRRAVERVVVRLPIRFALWLLEAGPMVEDLGLAVVTRLPLRDPRAPTTWAAQWADCADVAATVALWQEDQWDAQWELNRRLGYGCFDTRVDPIGD